MQTLIRKMLLLAMVLIFTGATHAQAPFHFNFGGGVGWPQRRTADFANFGGHFEAGGGITLVPHVAINGEYMFYDLPVKGTIVSRFAATDASSHLHAVTGNVVLAFGSPSVGGYVIGGAGWYKRTWKVTHPVLDTQNECDAGLLWFGIFDCHEAVVVRDRTLASGSQSATGWNAGAGFTIGLGRDTAAKLYTEIRYHRAYHKGVLTEVLPLTIGVRW
jgi:hypothetical protein